MPGGLLNIQHIGNNNLILTGNPTKTFFKVTYSKYTNFGLQKFRLDYEGNRDLRLTEESTFRFKIKRYADLLLDTYIVVTLPDIWSPIHHPSDDTNMQWAPYDFRWIKDIGTNIVKEVQITCGSMLLQKYSGSYIQALIERDFPTAKKEIFNRMTGNVDELNNPAYAYGRIGTYPSAYYTPYQNGAEPSIRSRTLYIPINSWFTFDSRCAFPLVSLQYNELEISVTLRSAQELIQIRDIYDVGHKFPYIQPDFNRLEMQMYRFLQTPPSEYLIADEYTNKVNTWNADVHLIATYCFLSKEEQHLFAAEDQIYLVKDIFEYQFYNVTGSKKLQLTSNGMVSSWMWYLQRNDVALRNEWSNYTNWPYRSVPSDITQAPSNAADSRLTTGPLQNPNGINTGFYVTGDYTIENRKDILETMAIVLNGEYRELNMTRGVYDYIEKYGRSNGSGMDGIYCYNFCLNTNPYDYQPSGAINMSMYKTVELEITTYVPPIDSTNSTFNVICNDSGDTIGITKQNWRLYEYNYNLTLFEERYNIISFINGNCGMLYAR